LKCAAAAATAAATSDASSSAAAAAAAAAAVVAAAVDNYQMAGPSHLVTATRLFITTCLIMDLATGL